MADPIEITMVYEPAAGDGCYRSQIEAGAPDHILRLDRSVWESWNKPGTVVVTVKAAMPDVASS